jgi:hypothetical protein
VDTNGSTEHGLAMPASATSVVDIALRCRDVLVALRALVAGGAGVVGFRATRLIGMAVGLASAVRGQLAVADTHGLRMAGSRELAVDPDQFDDVVNLLEEIGFLRGVERREGAAVAFWVDVPRQDEVLRVLGRCWMELQPTDTEHALVEMVDLLAAGPMPAADVAPALAVRAADLADVLELGRAAGLVRSVRTTDGDTLYSPLMAFEQPTMVATSLAAHGPAGFWAEIPPLRQRQGVEAASSPELADAVARGLLPSVTATGPAGDPTTLAFLPDPADPTLLRLRKDVLDKAMALAACLRLAQHFGLSGRGVAQVLGHLCDHRNHVAAMAPIRAMPPALQRMQLIDFTPSRDGRGLDARLVATADNLSALSVATDLLRGRFGESIPDGPTRVHVAAALACMDSFAGPLPALVASPLGCRIEDHHFSKAVSVLMGRSRLARALDPLDPTGRTFDSLSVAWSA